jgi:hypothetical protein
LFLLLSSTTQIFLIYLSLFLIVNIFTAGLIWFGFDWMEQVQQTILKHNTEKFWKYWAMWNFKKFNTHSHFEKEFKKNEIPNSISTLTHLHTFKLIGIGQQKANVKMNAMSSLHNQIQTCIIENVSSVARPEWRQWLSQCAPSPEVPHSRMGGAARRRDDEATRVGGDGATKRWSDGRSGVDEKARRRGAELQAQAQAKPREMSSCRGVEPTSQRSDETTARQVKTDEL